MPPRLSMFGFKIEWPRGLQVSKQATAITRLVQTSVDVASLLPSASAQMQATNTRRVSVARALGGIATNPSLELPVILYNAEIKTNASQGVEAKIIQLLIHQLHLAKRSRNIR